MINQSPILCFQLSPRQIIPSSDRLYPLNKDLQQTQDQTIRSLTRLGINLTVSLRYDYDPNQSPQLRTYLLIRQNDDQQNPDFLEQIASLVTKGKLSNFLILTPQTNWSDIQTLDWVKIIGEILKPEDWIEPQNCYFPQFFKPNPANDMLAVYDVIHRLDRRLILEITLKTYQNPNEKQLWVNGINQMLTQLEKVNSSGTPDQILSTALNLYRSYQQIYTTGELVQYSIKALGENQGDVYLVLNTLLEHATEVNNHQKSGQIVIVGNNKSEFSDSLNATQTIDIYSKIQGSIWQRSLENILIRDAIKPKKTGLAKFSDDSLSLSNPRFTPPLLNSNQNQPQSSDLVLGSPSGLAKFAASPPAAKIKDLKPLHRLATLSEIAGFFRIPIPPVTTQVTVKETMKQLPEKLTIEDVIQNYGKLITEDTYIVGVDEQGEPCISNFSKIPHRIIAGVPGSGKTNFITSVIYQFLHANPQRQIYIADFQAGLHYQFIVEQQPTVKMITQAKDCAELLAQLWEEHENRRTEMVKHRVRSLANLHQKTNIKKDRILLIIDEASYIKTMEKAFRVSIESHLNNLAAQSRVTGIHIIYCSQRPTTEVIDPQISNNMDERIIFRVSSSSSNLLLSDVTASNLPVDPPGRAIYRGIESQLKMVATPYVPDDIWENPLC